VAFDEDKQVGRDRDNPFRGAYIAVRDPATRMVLKEQGTHLAARADRMSGKTHIGPIRIELNTCTSKEIRDLNARMHGGEPIWDESVEDLVREIQSRSRIAGQVPRSALRPACPGTFAAPRTALSSCGARS